MSNGVAVKVVEEELAQVYSKTSVHNMLKEDTTDYERGMASGKIVALTKVLRVLNEGKTNADKTIRTKIQK